MLFAVTTTPRQILNLAERTMIHLQVATGPAQVRIAQDYITLETQVAGLPQGLVLTSSGGIYSLWWKGPLWIVADQDCYVNIIRA
jgi:hypothetical protein